MSDKKPVILTGLRTNAEYHLGNYLGAIKPMVELQQKHLGEYQVNMFAPDLHSFTTEVKHDKLYQQTHDNLKVFIAAGMPVDNDDFFMYRQSVIPAHSELTVILNNFAYFGELNRMTQFKEKKDDIVAERWKRGDAGSISADNQDGSVIDQVSKEMENKNISVGLFDYPVLMAADILLYNAKYVPVGEDQRQHLELTRKLAIRMNNKFGDLFVIPEPWDKQLEFAGRDEGVRIRSLRRPENKMSKSIDDPTGTVLLSDSPESAKEKVMSATTDNEGKINWDWDKQPGVTNLLQILELMGTDSREDVLNKWRDQTSYGELKASVADTVAGFLKDFHVKLSEVTDDHVENTLARSETKMREVANQTLSKVQQAVGLRRANA